MPDQNPTDPTVNPPANQDTPTSPFATTTTIPPVEENSPAGPTMPPDEAPVATSGTSDSAPPPPVQGSDLPPAPPIVESAGQETGGSAAPAFDINSSITPPPTPKKKFGGKKVIATILGILVLVGGLGAGIILVQQQQDIRQRAKGTDCSATNPCTGGYVCKVGFCVPPTSTEAPTATKAPTETPKPPEPTSTTKPPSCGYSSCSECRLDASYQTCINLGCCPQPTVSATPTPTTPPVNSCAIAQRDPLSQGYCDRSAPNTADCTDKNEGTSCSIRSTCGGGTGSCVVIEQGGANAECQCQSGGGGGGTPTPTSTGGGGGPTPTAPPGGGVVAQCLNIKAFDTDWNELTSTDLNSLKVGDKVRFTVAGTASAGSFDRAKFNINGVDKLEVTAKRPGTDEFFDEYIVPAGATTFTISAKIHHVTLGWSL